MSLPTTATVTQAIAARATTVYDQIADVTNMGRWSPECRSCEWLDEPGLVGSRFRGHNRSGAFRWTTEARVLVADRGREFSFATLHRGELATRWTYRFEGAAPTTVTESFEAIRTPRLLAFAERYLIRDRQQQLEDGMRRTLAALKEGAEAAVVAGTEPDA
ncbi:MAG: SRPBCC family protein [Acidimicrobiales bacterium]